MTHRWFAPLISLATLGLLAAGSTAAVAQGDFAIPTPPVTVRTTPIGFPQDAGPHDANSVIEWWYVNAFLTSASGHHYAVVGSFFRTGLTPEKKGHYLIYSLADLDAKTRTAYSILDKASISLLKTYLFMAASQHPEDPAPMRFLGMLQKNELPKPHRALATPAVVTKTPLFSIAMGENRIAEATPDGRNWKVTLHGDDFTVDMTLAQPTRPAMLVGGQGKTGVSQPDDMYYLSLTHMDATGSLTHGGKTEAVIGPGWLDRQWGQTWGVMRSVGWDWFGLHREDGSDLIVYRLRDTNTGKTLKATATILDKDGKQTVDDAVTLTSAGTYTDPASKIVYPAAFTITLPDRQETLEITPLFPDQTIPVLTGGDAIWEGAVSVRTTGGSSPGAGSGYMELVGYKPAPSAETEKKTP